jgi:osmotically-inducible protein OsmY
VAAIDRNPLLDAESIDVTAEDGAVTLTGESTTWLGRKAAYEAALYAPGVTDINDRINVPV